MTRWRRRRGRSRDELAADLLDVAGGVVSTVAIVLGRADAGAAVRGMTSAAADAIRSRGVATDRIVEALRHVGPLRMPWDDREGKE